MKRASYREAIRWIADNDDTDWVGKDGDGVDLDDALRCPSVTACIVADLFDVSTERVRADIRRHYAKEPRT